MDRRSFVAGTLALLAAPLVAEAQPPAKVFRVGILGQFPPTDPESARLWDALHQGLRELGYVEGQNLVVERRYSEGRNERLPALAAELVQLKVDVIVAGSARPAHAAKRATSTIPIVFGVHSDPVGSGLVDSLARPGGNITGLSLAHPDILGKQLQLLKEAVPSLSRVAVLSNPSSLTHLFSLGEVRAAARSSDVRLQVLAVRAPSEFAGAFAAMTKERAGGLIVLGEPMFFRERTRIAELAVKHRLPMMAAEREHAEAGGLLAYGANLRELFRRAATYVDKILKGAKPADLPIEQPTEFELIINMKTAKALGLIIPQSVLLRADEVIE